MARTEREVTRGTLTQNAKKIHSPRDGTGIAASLFISAPNAQSISCSNQKGHLMKSLPNPRNLKRETKMGPSRRVD